MKIVNAEQVNQELLLQSSFPLHSIWPLRFRNYFSCEYGFVALEKKANTLILAGDPCLVTGTFSQFFNQLESFCFQKGYSYCGYYFSQDLCLEMPGLPFIKGGTTGFCKVQDFDLDGYGRRDSRRAKNYWQKKDHQVLDMRFYETNPFRKQLQNLREKWLKSKAGLEVSFLIGAPPKQDPKGQWLLLVQGKRVIAYLSYYPYNGTHWYLDQMVFDPEYCKFAIDYLIVELLFKLKERGAQVLSLGFNAFDELEMGEGALSRMMHLKSKNNFLYNNKSLQFFKKKYIDYKVPRFVLLKSNKNSLKSLYPLMRVTYPQLFV